jgi:hypothetical protein
VTPTKPGSCTKPLPGIFADIVDDEGRPVKTPGAGGYLVIKRPWPSMLRTIWGDNERYLKTYWERFQGRFYVAGDSAHRDADGYYWIMGRIDDVLNVAGHRLGTMEIESALVAHLRVAEAAVVSKPHDIKGESVFAYVVLNGPRPEGTHASALIEELRGWVAEQLSPIAKPDEIRLTDNLPKTRSGKIMRRLLRSIARGEEITQDMSTLENPAILDQLRGGTGAVGAPAVVAAPAPARKPAAATPRKASKGGKASKVPKASEAAKGSKAPKPSKASKASKASRAGQLRKPSTVAKRPKAVAAKRKAAVAKNRAASKKGAASKKPAVKQRAALKQAAVAKKRAPTKKPVRRKIKARGKK